MKKKQAVIMAGGKGTRLRPYTYVLPKPLVPVGERPILELLLQQLAQSHVTQVVIVGGYKAEILMAVIGDGHKFGVDISYYIEESPLGTMGALSFLDSLDDNFLVMNGDICTNLNFHDLLVAHKQSGCALTVGSYPRKEQLELGVLELDASQSRIVGFKEKPVQEVFVSMGVYGLSRKALSFIPTGKFFGFDNLMHNLLAVGEPINSYLFSGRWYDIGRPDDYALVQDAFEKEGHTLFGLQL